MCHAKEAVKEFHQTHPDAKKLTADDLWEPSRAMRAVRTWYWEGEGWYQK